MSSMTYMRSERYVNLMGQRRFSIMRAMPSRLGALYFWKSMRVRKVWRVLFVELIRAAFETAGPYVLFANQSYSFYIQTLCVCWQL